MLMPILKIAELPVLALTLAAVVMPLAKGLAHRFGIVSVPYSDSRHKQQKPLMGGLAIVAAILITLAIGHMLPLWLMVGVAGLFLVGLGDDAIEFSPSRKFLLQIVPGGFVVVTGPAFRRAPLALLNAALTGFFLISTVNAFNLIDGLDGLAAGVGIIAALRIASFSGFNGDAGGARQALI